MLIQRIITAIIFGILVVVGAIYLSLTGFILLATLIVSIAAWEFAGFYWKNNYLKKIGFVALFLLVASGAIFYSAIPTLIVGGLWWLIAPYFLWRYTQNEHNYFINWYWQALLGLLIFVPCLVGLIEIQEMLGAEFLLYLLGIVCAADIGAYFSGRFWGKHLLAEKVSPKKTVEGLIGGVITSLVVAIIASRFLTFNIFVSMRGVSFLILIITTSLWSVIGDLFESMLKRQGQVKDSGKLLPGHGGMYDRIDSLTAAVVIFVLGCLLI